VSRNLPEPPAIVTNVQYIGSVIIKGGRARIIVIAQGQAEHAGIGRGETGRIGGPCARRGLGRHGGSIYSRISVAPRSGLRAQHVQNRSRSVTLYEGHFGPI